jgi:hypothetical protein
MRDLTCLCRGPAEAATEAAASSKSTWGIGELGASSSVEGRPGPGRNHQGWLLRSASAMTDW